MTDEKTKQKAIEAAADIFGIFLSLLSSKLCEFQYPNSCHQLVFFEILVVVDR